MRKLTLAVTAACFLCASAAVAAPPSASLAGLGQAMPGDLMQVKLKRKRLKKGKMKGQGMQGGSAGAGQPGGMPAQSK